jgi:hypothetical protein
LALDQDDYPAARAWLSQSLISFPEFDRLGIVHGLAVFAALAAAEGLPPAALRLAGAAAAVTRRTGISIDHTERGRYERWLASARQVLGEEVAAEAWARGYQMRLEHAIAWACRSMSRAAAIISNARKATAGPARR